jgi:hypothetical protein
MSVARYTVYRLSAPTILQVALHLSCQLASSWSFPGRSQKPQTFWHLERSSLERSASALPAANEQGLSYRCWAVLPAVKEIPGFRASSQQDAWPRAAEYL